MSLPTKLKPGKDLMAKEALRDPKVINLITESLVKTTDDYFIGNCEWKDGTRSDMVLEPKNAFSDLPPLIVEIQHTICGQSDHLLMGLNESIPNSSAFEYKRSTLSN
ncbi:hypothetical protein BD770DRAFT_438527 [Pilaira anomala]|nr:hypothetical protein BD770DRAFT_438527 [Pilaira anomala]